MAATSDQRKAALLMATALAIPAEGLRRYAYYCPAGVLTTCYGHTGADVRKGFQYSIEECKALLTVDMRKAVEQVERCMPGLPAPILAAFGDAVFNIGSTVACDTMNSTAAKLLRAGSYAAACNQLPRWNRARVLGVMIELPGLTERRGNEQKLCLTGVA